MTEADKPDVDVEVETKELEGGQVELHVRVPSGQVSTIRDQVLRTFARRANIRGFRKGKAPRAVVERYIDQEALKEQIIDSLLADAYDAATEKAGIKPLDRARIADAEVTEDWTLTFSATVTLRPEITLGDYKGLTGTRHITRVTDAQVDAELERLRSRHARFTELPADAAIEKGDLVVVDYEMLVDGEKREDASASGYPLEVGADQLFPELNEALLGKRPGDAPEFDISYPESHSDKSLSGKTGHFVVTIGQVRRRQLPALDDAFAKQVSDLEGIDALRDRIRENLEAIGRAVAEEDVRNQLLRRASESASLDVPDAIVGRETDRRIDEITEELERRNLTLHQHLQQMGRSFEDWRADVETDARQSARRALILDEIGSREGLQVTEEEIHDEMHRLAEAEGIDEERLHERLRDSAEFNRLVTRLYHRKVLQFLVDSAQITEEVTDPSEEETPSEAEGADAEPRPSPEQ